MFADKLQIPLVLYKVTSLSTVKTSVALLTHCYDGLAERRVAHGKETVSYTHLDVYKRQDESFPSATMANT